MPTNTATLRGERIRSGIRPITQRWGTRGLEMGTASYFCFLKLDANPAGAFPLSEDDRLLEASISSESEQRKRRLLGGGQWPGGLLLISGHETLFKPSPLGLIRSVWVGGDGPIKPVCQIGDYGDPSKSQLFAFEPNDWLVVLDPRASAARIDYANGSFSIRPVERPEFGSYLVMRAHKIRHHRGLFWTKKTLQSIQMGHLWSSELETALSRYEHNAQPRHVR